jgi:hypothetical protein
MPSRKPANASSSQFNYKPEIWGPHYWFVMHTMAQTYPLRPSQSTKRKYYDFIMNLPLFLPDAEIGNRFSQLIDSYPVSPYLDKRDNFVLWVHFIHNKINVSLGKPEMTTIEALEAYQRAYESAPQVAIRSVYNRRRWLLLAMTVCALAAALYLTFRKRDLHRKS